MANYVFSIVIPSVIEMSNKWNKMNGGLFYINNLEGKTRHSSHNNNNKWGIPTMQKENRIEFIQELQ